MSATLRKDLQSEVVHFGDVLWDLHDGMPFTIPGYTITKRMRISGRGGNDFIQRCLRYIMNSDLYQYTNKTVVVIGETQTGGFQLACSYDDRYLYLFEIEKVIND